MNKTAVSLMIVAILSGCASQPEDVVATYVSSSTYSGYGCRQLISERNQVVTKVNELNGAQKKKADGDAVAMGVGMILFWPALFFIGDGKNSETQLASMKGNYDALTVAAKAKGCI